MTKKLERNNDNGNEKEIYCLSYQPVMKTNNELYLIFSFIPYRDHRLPEEREVSAVTDSLPPRGFRRRETVIICHDITSPLALCPPCPVDRKGCVTLDVSRIVFRLCLRRAEECLGSGCLGEVSNLRPSRSPLRMAAFDPVPCAPMILRTWHVGLVP